MSNFPIVIDAVNGIKNVNAIFLNPNSLDNSNQFQNAQQRVEDRPSRGHELASPTDSFSSVRGFPETHLQMAQIVDPRVNFIDPKLVNGNINNLIILDSRFTWRAQGAVITVNGDTSTTVDAKTVEEKYKRSHYYDVLLNNSKLFTDSDVDQEFNKMRTEKMKLATHERKICTTYGKEQICYDIHTPLSEENEKILYEKLVAKAHGIKPLKLSHLITVNDLHLTADTLISSSYDENVEAGKIMNWISNELIVYRGGNATIKDQTIFGDLMQTFSNGYIYIARGGIDHVDTIHKEIIPNVVGDATKSNQTASTISQSSSNEIVYSNMTIQLKYFDGLIGKPLNDPLLVSTVSNVANNTIGDEALKVLSIENFICLQPQPRYLLYVLKRLIIAWYSDIDLSSSILKIKILVNHYRARRDVELNQKVGVLPMIMIYLRYGDDQLDKAFQKINYYFTNFINTAWVDNDPTYFFKYNPLLYLCNGHPDVKRYFDMNGIVNVYKPFTQSEKAFLKYSRLTIAPFAMNQSNKSTGM